MKSAKSHDTTAGPGIGPGKYLTWPIQPSKPPDSATGPGNLMGWSRHCNPVQATNERIAMRRRVVQATPEKTTSIEGKAACRSRSVSRFLASQICSISINPQPWLSLTRLRRSFQSDAISTARCEQAGSNPAIHGGGRTIVASQRRGSNGRTTAPAPSLHRYRPIALSWEGPVSIHARRKNGTWRKKCARGQRRSVIVGIFPDICSVLVTFRPALDTPAVFLCCLAVRGHILPTAVTDRHRRNTSRTATAS
jgi:hypothetical protein